MALRRVPSANVCPLTKSGRDPSLGPVIDPPLSSAPGRRDPALDGLRGFAVLLVYLFHYGGGLRSHDLLARALGYLTQAGWVGVEIFFVLSGFLITSLLLDDLSSAGALPRFYMRRALRILPLYLAAVLACAGVALMAGASLAQLNPLLPYLGFLQNVPPLIRVALRTPPPLPLFHLWSLAVEEQFYLLWPLLLLLTRTPRRALALCLWIFGLSYAFRVLYIGLAGPSPNAIQSLAVMLPSRCGGLVFGSALALTRRLDLRTSLRRPALVLALFSVLAFVIGGGVSGTLLLKTRASFLLGLPAADLLALALLALALEPGRVRRILSWQALGSLGRISYGFYVLASPARAAVRSPGLLPHP